MPAITNFPMRLVAELLAMPTTKGSCYVSSPRSPVSGSVAGRPANGMRFCVRALHALVGCSCEWRRDSRFADLRLSKVRLAVAPVCGDFGTSTIPPVFSLLSLGHSLGAVPAPGGASMFCFVRHSERPSGLGFQQQISRATCARLRSCGRNFLPEPPQKAHLGLGSGAPHVASRKSVPRKFRAKPTWRKSSWHSTYQLCGIGAVLLSAICRAAPGRRAPVAADVTMSWLPTGDPKGALGRQITPWRRTE